MYAVRCYYGIIQNNADEDPVEDWTDHLCSRARPERCVTECHNEGASDIEASCFKVRMGEKM